MKYEINYFRDGQISAKTSGTGDLDITIRGNSYSDLFAVAAVKDAWDSNIDNKGKLSSLTFCCLIGQRSDRRFNENESFDLKVIAGFINRMGFDQVSILHPHSDTTLALIDKSLKLSHFSFVKETYKALNKPILVSPDAGAYKTTHEIAEKLNASLIPANKIRVNGKPEISIQGDVHGQDCLIVDDLADGGRTFTILADALKKKGATKIFLYVTHGQFNSGFDSLKENISHIYCTNSYRDIEDEFVTQYKVI